MVGIKLWPILSEYRYFHVNILTHNDVIVVTDTFLLFDRIKRIKKLWNFDCDPNLSALIVQLSSNERITLRSSVFCCLK